ncbi:hypothetical protein jhhlp_000634 [Lomentospora prolificans]|uniref:Bifunctional cytochrome P450/NADPH--P450 reductase n=1 Tax=Lomentospora prolificans TaxID=41688 RepID=A0A2N3NJ31_9PEZI|nr:hypothetical protein jhhlp_000634 [Lomentospora prolificans]
MSERAQETVPIPEPQGLPILGNIGAIDPNFPLGSMLSLSNQFGEIYRLRLPNRTIVVVSTRELVNETCDEKRFQKTISAALKEVRHGVHDGLFTAYNGSEDWAVAHRILMPAFGPLSIRNMYPEMHDIATQLAMKWARYGPNTPIMVTDDFTRLTLDTIALCSMDFRFNSYYSPEMHPFIEAMGDFLKAAGARAQRLPLPSLLYRAQDQKFDQDIQVLRSTAQSVLDARRAEKSDRKDLLTAMLNGVDPKTGRRMTDDSIMDNLITFLIAGHETTSGTLSFAFYQLLKHPEAYNKAQQEVDNVVGKGPITVDHLSKLPYLNAVLRETLRVNSPIPMFGVEAKEDTLLLGKYPVKKGEAIINLLSKSHVDPAVFGDDANEFKPERMLDDNFNRLNEEFPNCWKPFGNGMRACIGRPFAWQEALLVLAMLLQNFNFVLDPNYTFGIKQTLTIKPADMHFRAILRDGLTPTTLEQRLAGKGEETKAKGAIGPANDHANNDAASGRSGDGVPMTILYGSNSGTCEALAQRVAADASTHGFSVNKIDCLDSANGKLPKGQPVVIITSSYEGQPPDNAGHFVAWLEGLKDKSVLSGVSYTVFGCGHRDWTQTFHRIPKLVDARLEECGATRVAKTGLSDVSNAATFTDFEAWEDECLWPSLKEQFKTTDSEAAPSSGMKVQVLNPRTSALRQDVKEAVVIETKTLTTGKQVKKHIEIKLPEGMTYSAGDYLAVLPINPEETVRRVLRRFQLPWDAHLVIKSDIHTSLPVNTSVPAHHVLGSYVELAQPATKRNILGLVDAAADAKTKDELNRLANDGYNEDVTEKRCSVLDLLERFPAIDLDIGTFLAMMPPMRIRQYSISSSPLWNPDHVTLTYSVVNAPSLSGQGSFFGVASSYLSSLSVGDHLAVAVRPSPAPFAMPPNPEETPIICICAGTGLAPFKGFIQERATMIRSGRKLAPAMLFFGCRSPDDDDLYREQFDEWEKLGAVEVRRAYSQKSEESNGARHVQDRLWADRKDVIPMWAKGAKVFVCGARKVSDEVRDVCVRMREEYIKEVKGGKCDQDAEKWFDSLRNIRYVMDVFD